MEQKMYANHLSWKRKPADEDDHDDSESAKESSQNSDLLAEKMLAQSGSDRRTLSVIGQTLVFKGDLSAEEDLLIQGRVFGTIMHNAQNLTIGAHGNVEADIVAQHVIIQGNVRGEVRASESITVEASARVEGNLYAPRIGLKEGAKFKGSIDMGESWEQPSGMSYGADKGASPQSFDMNNSDKGSSGKKSSKSKSSSSSEQDGELSDETVDKLLD